MNTETWSYLCREQPNTPCQHERAQEAHLALDHCALVMRLATDASDLRVLSGTASSWRAAGLGLLRNESSSICQISGTTTSLVSPSDCADYSTVRVHLPGSHRSRMQP